MMGSMMEKCNKCFAGYMAKWETPQDDEFMYVTFLHICSQCGHAVEPDMRRFDGDTIEVQQTNGSTG